MILSVFSFSGQSLKKMILKSILGYAVALFCHLGFYILIAKMFESEESFQIQKRKKPNKRAGLLPWLPLVSYGSQWANSGFLPIFMCICEAIDNSLSDGIYFIILVLNGSPLNSRAGKSRENCPLKANTQAYPFSHLYRPYLCIPYVSLYPQAISHGYHLGVYRNIGWPLKLRLSYRLNKHDNEIWSFQKANFQSSV